MGGDWTGGSRSAQIYPLLFVQLLKKKSCSAVHSCTTTSEGARASADCCGAKVGHFDFYACGFPEHDLTRRGGGLAGLGAGGAESGSSASLALFTLGSDLIVRDLVNNLEREGKRGRERELMTRFTESALL